MVFLGGHRALWIEEIRLGKGFRVYRQAGHASLLLRRKVPVSGEVSLNGSVICGLPLLFLNIRGQPPGVAGAKPGGRLRNFRFSFRSPCVVADPLCVSFSGTSWCATDTIELLELLLHDSERRCSSNRRPSPPCQGCDASFPNS